MLLFFFFNDPAPTEIYTLSLHDALPISPPVGIDRGSSSRRRERPRHGPPDRKSTRLNSSHPSISYAVFCLKKKKKKSDYNIQLQKRISIEKEDISAHRTPPTR